MDRRPDRVTRLRPGRRAAGRLVGIHRLAETRHVLDRHDDLEVELLAGTGVDDLDVAVRAAEEAGDRAQRALRRRQADALRVGIGQVRQALE